MVDVRDMGTEQPEDHLVAAAEALVPTLRERARATESLRRVPDETVAQLKEAGLFRILQPAKYGGLEADLTTYYETVFALSAADTSVGWVHSVFAAHAWSVALYPERALDEIWGRDHDTLLCSASLCKEGGIDKVDNGYRMRGVYGFASGCHHGDWVMILGVARNAPEGGPLWCLVPKSDFEIVDNWYMAGLAGTGSCDLRIDSEIPSHRAISLMKTGSEVSDSPIYRLPFLTVFSDCLTLPIVGGAQGAYESYVSKEKERVSLFGVVPSADPGIQMTTAEAAADLDAARLSLFRNLGELMGVASEAQDFPSELLVRTERDRVLAIRRSVSAVDRIMANAGGRAFNLDNPLQRAWRDVHAAAAHAANRPGPALAAYGAHSFGIAPTDPGGP